MEPNLEPSPWTTRTRTILYHCATQDLLRITSVVPFIRVGYSSSDLTLVVLPAANGTEPWC